MRSSSRRIEAIFVILAVWLLALWVPEAPAANGKSILVEDVTGRKVQVPQPLKRAIWLEKGEIMYALGVTDRLCGIGTSNDGRFHAEYMNLFTTVRLTNTSNLGNP
ncbi:hypothetical protein EDC14_105228 [Hydrogenispora ethanolica]|uniref:Uncharacterized protein n=1 Tax=Hydrogenispora ethanolica TaxID=1082276 RepID=A0A4R1QRJ1_HYDET|nr:hypothetical protein [Hydrogenispora ethanolica]TCL56047.1 hypothetical protein EDC14_105228 [Hydrogenispora ethanolica]